MQEKDKKDSCKSCRFWEGDGVWGVCKRYPPTFYNDASDFGSAQISTSHRDWCGEFKELEKTVSYEGYILDQRLR